jgi:hypothetical protein
MNIPERSKGVFAISNCNGFYAIITNYHSISDFRKQNPSGLKNLFKLFVFFKDADLIGCEIIAIDGTCCAKSPEFFHRLRANPAPITVDY